MKIKIFLAIFLLSLIPVYASDISILSFEENLNETSVILTADKTKVSVTSFSTEKNESEEVPVYIDDVVNLSEVVIFVKYDNSVIKPENVSNGDFNVTYTIEDEVKINLDLNESFTGDFLLAEIFFRVVGDEGESTSLTIEVSNFLDNNSNKIPYLTIDGMFYIPIKNREEKSSRGSYRIGDNLSGLIRAENKSKFADENNLEFEDNKVRVIVETNNTTEDRFIVVDNLSDLVNNDTIKNIRPYREKTNKELIILAIILIAIFLVSLKFLKQK